MKICNGHLTTRAALLVMMFFLTSSALCQTVDGTFNAVPVFRPGEITIIRPAAKNKVYVAGNFTHHGSHAVKNLVRLTPSGFLDTSFKPEISEGHHIASFDVLPNGNLVVGAGSGDLFGRYYLYLLASDGRKLKLVENEDFRYDIPCIRALPDNRVLVAGFSSIKLYSKLLVPDPTFPSSFYTDAPVDDMEIQGSSVLISGDFSSIGTDPLEPVGKVVRIGLDGSIDKSFQSNFFSEHITDIAVAEDLTILLSIYENNTSQLVRLKPDGTRDTSFASEFGAVSAPIIYNNSTVTFRSGEHIQRVDMTGSPQPSFTPISIAAFPVAAVLPDNSLLIGNRMEERFGIARFDANGTHVPGYKAQLTKPGIIHSLVTDGNSVVIAGDFVKAGDHLTFNVAKLHSTGNVDKSLTVKENPGIVTQIGSAGWGNFFLAASNFVKITRYGQIDPTFAFVPPSDFGTIKKFAIQKDRKVIVGGTGTGNIYRLNRDGSHDHTFNIGSGFENSIDPYYAYDFDLDPNDKVLYFGLFNSFNGEKRKILVRLNKDGSLDESYNVEAEGSIFSLGKIKSLPDGGAILTGSFVNYNGTQVPHGVLKVDANGNADEDFLSNYNGDRESYMSFIQPLGDAILLAENSFYSGFIHHLVNYSGTADNSFTFPANMEVTILHNLSLTQPDILFVSGDLMVDGSQKQLVKLRLNEVAPALLRVDNESVRFTFYPNPTKDFMTIQSDAPAKVLIYTQDGTKVISSEMNTGSQTLDLTTLPQGRYVFKAVVGDQTFIRHLVKN